MVIAIVGPTCTGKTDLAIELALRLNGEIISCDSRTIYRQMDIGTAKPTPSQQSQIKHHLIDVIEPDRFYSVAEYQKTAEPIMKEILSSNKIPIVVGGTGLYARALLQGIQPPAIPAQEELRKHLNIFADQNGNASLHVKLRELDPVSADRLNVNDRLRVIRALEVSMIAGRPFSEMIGKIEPLFETIWLGLYWRDRTCQKETVISRFNKQMELGLLDEVKKLWMQPCYRAVLQRAINYKEFIPHLENNENLDLVREKCILHNLQLARKQMMWFKANPQINWFAVDEFSPKAIIIQILNLCAGRLPVKSYNTQL